MKKINWSDVEAASDNYAQPPAGGYILAICAVEDVPQKEYIKVYFDIAGVADKANEQFVGYYGQRHERNSKVPLGSFIRSYKESAQNFFKGFLVALEKSGNRGFAADRFDGNEQQFVGMVVGAVMGEEEYEWQGKVRIRLKVKTLCSVERIQKGDFTIPELEKLDPAARATSNAAPSNYVPFSDVASVSDDEIPF